MANALNIFKREGSMSEEYKRKLRIFKIFCLLQVGAWIMVNLAFVPFAFLYNRFGPGLWLPQIWVLFMFVTFLIFGLAMFAGTGTFLLATKNMDKDGMTSMKE